MKSWAVKLDFLKSNLFWSSFINWASALNSFIDSTAIPSPIISNNDWDLFSPAKKYSFILLSLACEIAGMLYICFLKSVLLPSTILVVGVVPICFIPNNLPNLLFILATGIALIKSVLANKLFIFFIYCSLPKTPNLSFISFLYCGVLVFLTMYWAIALGLVPTLNIASVISFLSKAFCSALVSPVMVFAIAFIALGNTFALWPVGFCFWSISGWTLTSGDIPFSVNTSWLTCLVFLVASSTILGPILLAIWFI